MGFFKKLIRKVTRPVSKVLDKVVPNEIKPFLPYAAAFAPMFAPGMFASGASGLGNLFKLGQFGGGALLGGGLNALGQLSQEGNEGDLNLLSTGIGALSGGMSQAKAGDFAKMKSGRAIGVDKFDNPIFNSDPSKLNFLDKTKNFALEGLEKGSGIMRAGAADPFSMDGLKAIALPASNVIGEGMANEARKAQKQYELDLAAYNQEQDDLMDIPGRSATFLQAYRAYGIDEDTIQDRMEGMDLIYSAPGAQNGGIMGYNMGGRVGFADRGFVGELRDNSENMIGEIAKVMFRLTPPGMMMFGMDKATELYNDLDEDGKGKVKEYAMDFGLRMASPPLALGKGIYDYFSEDEEEKAMGGRVGRAYGGGFGGIESAVQNVKDRDLKENLTIAKDTNMDMKSLAEEFLATYKRQPNSYDELMEFYKKKNGYNAGGEEVVEEQVINAANGGIMNARVPFVSGGFAKGLINAARFSDEAPLMLRNVDEVPSGLVDEMGQPLRRSVDEVPPGVITEKMGPGLSEFQSANRQRMGPGMLDYTAAGNPQRQMAEEFIQSIRTSDGAIDYKIAEAQIGRGIKLKGNETIEELIELFLYTGPNKKAIAAIGAGYAGLGGMAATDMAAKGGIMGYNSGGSVLPNGVEMDYRGGGFIPMGSKERADDVPARVSKNEFVMTADAVRAAGGGSVNQGAKKMYELMNNLEAKA